MSSEEDTEEERRIVEDILNQGKSESKKQRAPTTKAFYAYEDDDAYAYDDGDEFTFTGEKVASAVRLIGVSLSLAADATWRALRHGESMHGGDKQQQTPPPVGARGDTLSDYITKWNSRSVAVGTGWYVREQHHDPVGADPFMMSMFLVAFSAGLFYTSFVEAFILLVILDFVETLVWFTARSVSPVLAAELNACESRWVALVYNIFAIGAGLGTAFFVRETWPGLQSVWDALADLKCGSDGHFLVWAPCTDAQTFVAQALVFVLIFLAAFRTLYVPAIVGLVLVVSLVWTTKVTYDAANNIMLQALTAAYFWAWMAAPIKGTYVYNGLIALSFYLFTYSIAALSGVL